MGSPRHTTPGALGQSPHSGSAPRRIVNFSKRHHRLNSPGSEAKTPLWYKDAIIYELHVRAFLDSNGDGIGDFRGLTQKLDYLQDLGVTAIWLLPFYPSPLKDDGYDIADYFSINPIYGTLKDFKLFLAAAHARGLRVITELVVNHTSDQHPWFQRSRRAPPGTAWRDFYVWSDSPDKYKQARIIFGDFEPSNWAWDPVARAYFWHRFYSHQPDLNYDNPLVHKEITRVLDFWLDLGVDGLRLDAVPYLYEREGTSCENLPETHGFLKELRRHVDTKYGDRMLLAEANQWPEEAVSYFGSGTGDECHMAFHFPLMPRLFMAVRMEDRVPIVDILEQTPPVPETSQWALFLRNHDELTLEMVTDEERDYMYRVYANDAKARINLGIRRRLAPLLGNDRKRLELLKLLLFSLPGTPVLYYGDEIGMGDNIFLGDRNGVRTPMQWSSDKNAGFSRASPHALYLPIILDPEYHYEALNVEAQQRNPNSLFWWMKRAITLRKRYQAFGRGSLQFLSVENRKILAFVRRCAEEKILVVANLSRFSQPARIDLSSFEGAVPVELFGRAEFPSIGKTPYFLTLNPYAAFWFSLETPAARELPVGGGQADLLLLPEHWEELLPGDWRIALETRLSVFLGRRYWFAGKGRGPKTVQLQDALPIPSDGDPVFLFLLQVEYMEGDPDEYLLPVGIARGDRIQQLEKNHPDQLIARVRLGNDASPALLYATARDADFARDLLEAISRRRTIDGLHGELRAVPAAGLRNNGVPDPQGLKVVPGKAEQSNSTLILGDKFFLKLFRRLEVGPNPDLELERFLTEHHFPNVPQVAGWLEYRRPNGDEFTLGLLTRFLPQAQDAWAYTLDMLSRYFERVRTAPAELRRILPPHKSPLTLSAAEVPEQVVALIGTYLELARLLGQRTGEMHVVLASDSADRRFAPEPFTPFYQRALFQSMRNLTVQNLELLRRRLEVVPEFFRPDAQQVVALEPQLLKRLHAVTESTFSAKRIRCHGDCHLGQILYTGKDFIFIDFEGEPARPLGERRIKRSPLRDVAGLLRSFDYIANMGLHKQVELGNLQESEVPRLAAWTDFWQRWVGAVYLQAYVRAVADANLLPSSSEQLATLLEAHLLEKAVYEVGYELNHRPNWVIIPLRGILRIASRHETAP